MGPHEILRQESSSEKIKPQYITQCGQRESLINQIEFKPEEEEKRRDKTMSWQTYVDDHLMCEVEGNPGQHLSAAAIIGHDGSVWAQSSTFPQVHLISIHT